MDSFYPINYYFLENEITIFIFLSVFIVFVLFKSKLLIKNNYASKQIKKSADFLAEP